MSESPFFKPLGCAGPSSSAVCRKQKGNQDCRIPATNYLTAPLCHFSHPPPKRWEVSEGTLFRLVYDKRNFQGTYLFLPIPKNTRRTWRVFRPNRRACSANSHRCRVRDISSGPIALTKARPAGRCVRQRAQAVGLLGRAVFRAFIII